MTPKLKGSILLDQIAHIETLYGRSVIEKAYGMISPTHRNEVMGALPISWLSTEAAQAFKDAIAEQVGVGSLMFNRMVVRHGIAKTINSLWRVLLRQLWDGAIIKRTPILYAKTFDRGKMSLQISGDHTATFELDGWPQIPEYDCVGLAEGIEALLEFSGRKGATVQWRRSGALMLFDASWQRRK